ncbi:YggS family pyridoxal phosphate-dependent enzyme [Halobacillus karajensis]|uniref:Pyridoxal phosphate homeostasis protein n=1 Tax=Halobacillus karajensis TaxID=195088 RepID=A0A024P2K1_9BACI|nr:YggS family pyridoxal phosphate-dependent enzyme [Halobacillus karajensis]CDQ19828.1 pyridoxal phosphate enzyme, YggS family [Halobacillus karajensis]CDQ22288.1 pyridoxal phosphate enzyme, YggS family [Halobacillus karajensis]CDQ28129.1 pyridoxal phosphate enzyme, YggS family [Halobacillus karajensis]
MSVADNLAKIEKQIEQACKTSGRSRNDITIIAVTKYVSTERAQEAVQAGLTHLGENRKEGLLEKYETIGVEADWHFIGTLQSRKVKDIVGQVSMIHSLDRKSLAKEINKRAPSPVPCFVQVNISEEESKHGLDASEVEGFIEMMSTYENVKIVGLMTMAPHTEDEEKLRGVFRQLRALRDRIRDKGYPHAPCEYLSMGMSNDYVLAIEEGATHIRLGSSLVGE